MCTGFSDTIGLPDGSLFGGPIMRRHPVSKGKSARHFRHNVQHTKSPNVNRTIMRGGWRL